MERSIFQRNMSFAAIVLVSIVVNVYIITHKIDLSKAVIQATNFAVQYIEDFTLPEMPDIVVNNFPLLKKIEKTKALVDVPKNDLTCMAENIYYEAGNQSYVGKLAVGLVVLNRVKSPSYPSTICGVIYEGSQNTRTSTCQFSWTCAEKKPIVKTSLAWINSFAVAKELLTHETKDLTEGAKFYHATYVNPIWNKSVKKVAQIDDHIFYK